MASFTSPCNFVQPTSVLNPNPEIILVIWAEASQNGCKYFADTVASINSFFYPKVIAFTPSSNVSTGKSVYFLMNLGLNVYYTVVDSETAADLESLPNDSVITITSSNSKISKN